MRLYEKGLIYRGHYIVNWCPRCQTALSDEEVEHVETEGSLWYIRYPVEGHARSSITVATTRPETMLGDTGVAVNPEGPPLRAAGRQDRGAAAGAPRDPDRRRRDGGSRSSAPARSRSRPRTIPNDFEIGKRHDLPELVVHGRGRRDERERRRLPRARPLRGARSASSQRCATPATSRRSSRTRYSVGHCSRCDTVIEPYLSLAVVREDGAARRARDRGGEARAR